jgi:hypothetical protein
MLCWVEEDDVDEANNDDACRTTPIASFSSPSMIMGRLFCLLTPEEESDNPASGALLVRFAPNPLSTEDGSTKGALERALGCLRPYVFMLVAN